MSEDLNSAYDATALNKRRIFELLVQNFYYVVHPNPVTLSKYFI